MNHADCSYGDILLSATGISLALDGKPILRDVNLEIRDLVRPGYEQGQIVGLLGPSGMGKTRLFRILAGLDKPDSGQVLLGKERQLTQPGRVGVVAQNYPLFAHRTVMGNLVLAGKLAKLSGDESKRKSNELLERFGLTGEADKYPSQLSGGQRQRVAIAQQFMCGESFLLMDEPFSGLDLNAVDRVIGFIQDITEHDEFKTFIIVTHDIAAAVEVCDTIWVLGRDRDSKGEAIPGARIQATYNLVERGLAWEKGITTTPQYQGLMAEIRDLFPRL